MKGRSRGHCYKELELSISGRVYLKWTWLSHKYIYIYIANSRAITKKKMFKKKYILREERK